MIIIIIMIDILIKLNLLWNNPQNACVHVPKHNHRGCISM